MKKKYDAFISYRHCDPDKYVAELLHKQMEAFRLPGRMNGTCLGRGKVFYTIPIQGKEELLAYASEVVLR